MDFISIIIPAFNSERWLGRCIDSILSASDADCEIIIVDDGSTDNTAQIARRYSDADPRIVVLPIEHSGPCAARKAGFDESQGDYIMFVDSDDVLPPNSIRDRRLLSLATPHDTIDTDLTTNNHQPRQCDARPMIVVTNTVGRVGDDSELMLTGHRRALSANEFALELLSETLPAFLPACFFSREILESIDWDNDPSITHHDSAMLLLTMAIRLRDMTNDGTTATRLVLVDPSVVCYNYLRRPGSQSVMMSLTHNGLNLVWRHLCAIDLPEPDFTFWGLDLIRKSFIERGIPFENDFEMSRNLLSRALHLGDDLPERYRQVVASLMSTSKRRRIARRMSREGGLTSVAPHVSFVLVCHRNFAKVARSIKSVFDTGFRNIEVILVDYDNDHSTSVALNRLIIRYPRMRIVKAEPGLNLYGALRTGVTASSGLALLYIRPGDRVGAEGTYDAVRSIDYGADLVLTNTRRRSRILGLKDAPTSFAYLAGNSATPHNIYDTLVRQLRDDRMGNEFLGFGLLWRRDALVDTGIDANDLDGKTSPKFTRRLMMRLLDKPLRVVAQRPHIPAAYEYTVPSLILSSFST